MDSVGCEVGAGVELEEQVMVEMPRQIRQGIKEVEEKIQGVLI